MDTKKLRQKILDLAIHGKLVPQDPNDEPASVLLERIRIEKEKLIKEGKIKAPKKSKSDTDTSHYPKEVPFEVPEGWIWSTLGAISSYGFCPSIQVEQISDNSWVLELEDIEKDTGKLISKKTKIERSANGIRYSFERGQVLYSKLRTYLNKVLIAEQKGFCSTEIMPISFYGGVLAEYMVIVLSSPYFLDYTASCGYGVKMPRLGTNDAIKAAIPIPPLAEQRIIVRQVKQLLSLIDELSCLKETLSIDIENVKHRILELAIQGKLVPQAPIEEPAIELLRRINSNFQASDNLHYDGKLPPGWALCCLEDILDYEQPQTYIVNSTDYSDDNKTPVLTPGKSFVLGYTNEVFGICNRLPVIIFDDFTTDSKYVDFPFKVKSSAMKILHARGKINLRYVAHFMSITRLAGDTHKRYWISEYSKIPIPIPPLREQEKIVSTVQRLFNQLDNLIAGIEDDL